MAIIVHTEGCPSFPTVLDLVLPGHKSRIAAGGKKVADVDNRSLRLPRKIDNRGKVSQSRRPEPYRLAAKFGQAVGQGAES